jgi:glutamate/aspartate transport system substrate-binding protein
MAEADRSPAAVDHGKDHAESFLLLAGQIANARSPGDCRIRSESLRQEPCSMMLRNDDPQFKALVGRTVSAIMHSGEIDRIHAR